MNPGAGTAQCGGAAAVEASIVEDPALRQRLRFTRTRDPVGGEVLHVETWVDPGGGVTPHLHPAMEERFEMLEGKLTFLAGRRWSSAGPGETVFVPAGVRHAYRNKAAETAHFVGHVRPPSTLQEFLEDAAALGRAGKLTRRGPFPKGFDALLQGAVMAYHYREMVVLLFPPLPPPFVQRLIFPSLARLGARRGYRAGYFAEHERQEE
jgi:quercetin dioxygenase-like cupin family protein